MMMLLIIILIVLLIQIQSFIHTNKLVSSYSSSSSLSSSPSSSMRLYMKTKAITYTPIEIFKTTLLIKDTIDTTTTDTTTSTIDKNSIINIINKWDDESKVDYNIISEWENQGVAYRLSDTSITTTINTITSNEKDTTTNNNIKNFPDRSLYVNDMFINISSDDDNPVFIRSSSSSFIPVNYHHYYYYPNCISSSL
jgi:hypothetical protein